mmetsp:Transcript_112672/g.268521  ORF Transcript_112672/g.268521 Transcript_112672/m.268521 type:complete len:253 (+) Transcript_112672:218-976(+)
MEGRRIEEPRSVRGTLHGAMHAHLLSHAGVLHEQKPGCLEREGHLAVPHLPFGGAKDDAGISLCTASGTRPWDGVVCLGGREEEAEEVPELLGGRDRTDEGLQCRVWINVPTEHHRRRPPLEDRKRGRQVAGQEAVRAAGGPEAGVGRLRGQEHAWKGAHGQPHLRCLQRQPGAVENRAWRYPDQVLLLWLQIMYLQLQRGLVRQAELVLQHLSVGNARDAEGVLQVIETSVRPLQAMAQVDLEKLLSVTTL